MTEHTHLLQVRPDSDHEMTSKPPHPRRERRSSSFVCSSRRILSVLFLAPAIQAFTVGPLQTRRATSLYIIAPPGSGYARPEDESSQLPTTYEPMMEYPGTMRPGRTPENMPFHDLPIGDNDPDPVPWPHFQQIEWHHRWEPPHEHPIPMEEFIEMNGRWATPEMEAAMRAGVRQSVRERREQEEAEKRETIITDDDEDDDLDQDDVNLGDGVFGSLGSTAEQAAVAEAVSPNRVEETVEEEEEDGLDSFLLDLGLDFDLDDDDDEDVDKSDSSGPVASARTATPTRPSSPKAPTTTSDDDDEDDDFEDTSVIKEINVDDDEDDLSLGLDDDDDDMDGVDTVPLEDFGDSDIDTEDIFDEGGFDFDDGDFDGGDDMW